MSQKSSQRRKRPDKKTQNITMQDDDNRTSPTSNTFASNGSYHLVDRAVRMSGWRRFHPLITACICMIVSAGLLYTFVEHSDAFTSGITYFWWIVGLLIPLTFACHYLMIFFRGRRRIEDPSAALICSVEVCINNETVLTVRSWWSTNMASADVEQHGVRVAMSSARRWISENSNPGGKVSNIKFSRDAAADICDRYICIPSEPKHGETTQCSVCLDDLERSHMCMRTKKCNHEFHKDCLVNWISQSGRLSCPLCRADHFDLVPQAVLTQYVVKEEPPVSVLTVNIESGTLGMQ